MRSQEYIAEVWFRRRGARPLLSDARSRDNVERFSRARASATRIRTGHLRQPRDDGTAAPGAPRRGRDSKVLITGESGVGKDVVARYIHATPAARAGAVRRGQLRRRHRDAARVRALRPRQGQLHRRLPRQARQAPAGARGTLFLDEVGEMSLRMQALLLRFLENGEIQARRLGRIAGARRRARDRRDQPQPRRAGRRRPVPRGPVVPSARHPPPRAAAARAARRRPAAGGALPRGARGADAVHGRRAGAARSATAGRATSANCRTSSNSWSGSRDGRRSIGVEHLPASMRSDRAALAADARAPPPGRRRAVRRARQRAATRSGSTSIRCFSRATSRATISASSCGAACGRRAAATGAADAVRHDRSDYQRFHNFLTAHDCKVDFREFRNGDAVRRTEAPPAPAGAAQPGPGSRGGDAARRLSRPHFASCSGPSQTSRVIG